MTICRFHVDSDGLAECGTNRGADPCPPPPPSGRHATTVAPLISERSRSESNFDRELRIEFISTPNATRSRQSVGAVAVLCADLAVVRRASAVDFCAPLADEIGAIQPSNRGENGAHSQ